MLEKLTIKVTEWIGTPVSILVHTIFFIGIFALNIFGVSFDSIMLLLTTAVSLEAIYLAIFIQISVNRSSTKIQDLQEDVEDIQEDIDEIQEDVEDIQEDVGEIQGDVEDIQENVEDIGENFDEEEKPISDQTKIENLEKEIKEIKSMLLDIRENLKTKSDK